MSGKSIILAGGTGTGKSTFVSERLSKVPNKKSIQLYDVNNEAIYKPYIFTPFGSFEKFSRSAKGLSDSVIVFEEATIFLSNRGTNDDLRNILVRKRHTNVTVFLVFHSLRTVPRWIYDLSNFIVLFKTNDNEKLIETRFENELLTECFLRVQENSKQNPHYFETFSIY